MGASGKRVRKTGAGCAKRKVERGFTYIALLIFVAIMGVGLTAVAEVWHATVKREKEAELLFVGNQFRNAIIAYSRHAPVGAARYPTSLEDLLQDPRYPGTVRYLRKIFADPVTSSMDWGLVRGPNQEVLGVFSTSEEEPMKKGNFGLADRAFEGKTKYSEWVFMIPRNSQGQLGMGGTSALAQHVNQ